jgi:MFS-type transporter involved in bile tolerance (Atg22 family)
MKLPASLSLLKDRDFRTYFTAYAFHDLGEDIRLVGMGWLTLEMTHSQLWAGMITGIGGLTIAAFSPSAGVVVDRSNRRNLLIAVRASLMLVFLLAAILVISSVVEPWHLVLLGLAIGGVRALAGPTLRVFLLDLVRTDRMLTANSLVMASLLPENSSGQRLWVC